ncbi:prolipoprotein diacylglyceryl transferase [Patescibacteria group bacterium]
MSFSEFYLSLPTLIDPIVFSIGSFGIRWYSISYLIAFFIVIILVKVRISRGENDTGIKWDDIFDFLIYLFIGIIVGARIGYAFFYNFEYFLDNPLNIFYPVSDLGGFSGLYGMSFHGGIIGFLLVWLWYSFYKKVDRWRLVDFVVPAIPAGYFFGRIGNFLNGELYGRITKSFLAMDFGDGSLRHPSQLYEAFFEGLVLFSVLWFLRNRMESKRGLLSLLFLGGYSFFRFFVEFFREPDAHIGLVWGILTMGQVLSFSVFFLCFIFYKVRNYAIISKERDFEL